MIIQTTEIIKRIPNFSRYLGQFLRFPESSVLKQNIFEPKDDQNIILTEDGYLYNLHVVNLTRNHIFNVKGQKKIFNKKSNYNKSFIELKIIILQKKIPIQNGDIFFKKDTLKFTKKGKYQFIGIRDEKYYYFSQLLYGVNEITELQTIIYNRIKTFLQLIWLAKKIQSSDEKTIKDINNLTCLKKIGYYGPKGYPKEKLIMPEEETDSSIIQNQKNYIPIFSPFNFFRKDGNLISMINKEKNKQNYKFEKINQYTQTYFPPVLSRSIEDQLQSLNLFSIEFPEILFKHKNYKYIVKFISLMEKILI